MADERLPARRSNRVPQHYDPQRGLKAIAAAETAEKYFARAKDASKLCKAVETKLSEQRNFVLWWDTQEKAAGSRGIGKKVASWIGDATSVLADFGLSRDIVHRWRQRLRDDGTFEQTLVAVLEQCRRICELDRGAGQVGRAAASGEMDWHTPADIIAAARVVLGAIDLDPASSDAAQETIQATRYFTTADDGLRQPWGGRVWLNPPYAYPAIEQFVAKLLEEFASGRVTAALLLTNNSTDTAWFQQAAARASAVAFFSGRLHFSNAPEAPAQGQALTYFGDDVARFASVFRNRAVVLQPIEPTT
jgi:phage N-6-adenine-methyltransferase